MNIMLGRGARGVEAVAGAGHSDSESSLPIAIFIWMYGYYACRALSCKGKLRVDPLYLLENRSRDTQQMDADKVLEDPAGRRILDWLPLLIRGGGLVSFESLPDAILQGRID
jgi:hypothetical protein